MSFVDPPPFWSRISGYDLDKSETITAEEADLFLRQAYMGREPIYVETWQANERQGLNEDPSSHDDPPSVKPDFQWTQDMLKHSFDAMGLRVDYRTVVLAAYAAETRPEIIEHTFFSGFRAWCLSEIERYDKMPLDSDLNTGKLLPLEQEEMPPIARNQSSHVDPERTAGRVLLVMLEILAKGGITKANTKQVRLAALLECVTGFGQESLRVQLGRPLSKFKTDDPKDPGLSYVCAKLNQIGIEVTPEELIAKHR